MAGTNYRGYDSFAKIWYHTATAVHSHSIPTRPLLWETPGVAGSFTNWSEAVIPADEMVEDLIDKLKEVVLSTTVYDRYELHKWQPGLEEYKPVFRKAYNAAGTATGLTGEYLANQNTLSFSTVGLGLLKVVFLQRPNNNTWGNQNPVPADYDEVVAEIVDPTNAWSGRDNTRPYTATNVTVSQNLRLRRKFNMI